MPLGENIKKARLSKGMNQKELAEALKEKDILVGNTSISNWENNLNKPDPDTISALCEILDVDANFLLDFNKEAIKRTDNEIDNLLFSKAKDLSDEDKIAVMNVIDAIKRNIDNENND